VILVVAVAGLYYWNSQPIEIEAPAVIDVPVVIDAE
jgi:hypothetical protein